MPRLFVLSLTPVLSLSLLAGCAGSGKTASDPSDGPSTSTAPRADVMSGSEDSNASMTDAKAMDVPIIAKVTGQELPVSDPMLGLVNEAALSKLGLDQKFADEGVELDPQKHSVILLSLGQCDTAGYAADISALQRKGEELFVQGTATAPDGVDNVAQVQTYPFAAVAVEKLPQGTRVRSDIKSLP